MHPTLKPLIWTKSSNIINKPDVRIEKEISQRLSTFLVNDLIERDVFVPQHIANVVGFDLLEMDAKKFLTKLENSGHDSRKWKEVSQILISHSKRDKYFFLN